MERDRKSMKNPEKISDGEEDDDKAEDEKKEDKKE